MIVADLIRHKNRRVLTTTPGASVLDAARKMNDHHVGALVVVDDVILDKVVGMFTERDVLTRVVAARKEPERTTVAEVMTERVLTCLPLTSCDEVRIAMREKRIRHMPVINEHARLIGIVSIGDLNQVEVNVLAETVQYLERYSVRM